MKTPKKFSKDELKMPEEQFGNFAYDEQTSHLGIILGLLIVVLMVVLGGLYVWGQYLQEQAQIADVNTQRPTAEQNNEPESTNAEAEVETMGALSPSDEIEAIDADLQSTIIDNIDSEISAIEAEISN